VGTALEAGGVPASSAADATAKLVALFHEEQKNRGKDPKCARSDILCAQLNTGEEQVSSSRDEIGVPKTPALKKEDAEGIITGVNEELGRPRTRRNVSICAFFATQLRGTPYKAKAFVTTG
jgi:hypothetical protein